MEELNRKCKNVINYYLYTERDILLYSFKLDQQHITGIREKQQDIKKMISNELLKRCLNNDKDNFLVLYYFLIYHEELIEKDIDKVIDSLLKYPDLCKKYDVIFQIFKMNIKLSDDIIMKALRFISENKEDDIFLGIMPCDYRYYILRREEISNDIKEILIDTYNEREKLDFIEYLLIDIDNEEQERNIIDHSYQDIDYVVGYKKTPLDDDIIRGDVLVYKLLNK